MMLLNKVQNDQNFQEIHQMKNHWELYLFFQKLELIFLQKFQLIICQHLPLNINYRQKSLNTAKSLGKSLIGSVII